LLSANPFQTKFDERSGQDYRSVSVFGYMSGGEEM
jgi:hypothetical protein